MAGWALARYIFFGRRVVTFLVLGTMALPYFVVVIPQFVMVARDFGLANTWFALIVPPLFTSRALHATSLQYDAQRIV